MCCFLCVKVDRSKMRSQLQKEDRMPPVIFTQSLQLRAVIPEIVTHTHTHTERDGRERERERERE